MKLFRFDGPIMEAISFAVDLFVLDVLCLLLSIPIVTAGAAFTAKYYVTMKMVRKESPGVFKPYFKAFKENFKQSTLIWLFQLVLMALLLIDWNWMYNKGFENVATLYIILTAFLTAVVLCATISIFPLIARFKLTFMQAIRTALTFALIHFIPLLLFIAAQALMVTVCIWYMQWLPLVLVIGSISITLFYTMFLVKKFGKIERNYFDEDGNPKPKKNAGDAETENSEETTGDSAKDSAAEETSDSDVKDATVDNAEETSDNDVKDATADNAEETSEGSVKDASEENSEDK